jgi:hypothetical protein
MDKIDLIIDALEKAKDGWQCFDEYEKALAAARELRGQREITVKRKTLYGNETIYPVCDTAICLTMLGDTKTLTPRQIGIIKALGYKIVLAEQEEI